MATQPPVAPNHSHTVRNVSWPEFRKMCVRLRSQIASKCSRPFKEVYGIPVGGWFVARELFCKNVSMEPHPNKSSTIIVDDIVDTGVTIAPWVERGAFTAALFLKEGATIKPQIWLEEVPRSCWVRFPWEAEREIEDSVRRTLEYIGENPMREGLKDTPARVVKSWATLYGGYGKNPAEVLGEKSSFSEICQYDQMVVLKDIEFFSTCEHHMLPFLGRVHIGYLPDKRVAGISKLARMVEVFARRLQIQERMTQQIAQAIDDVLQPQGVGVVVESQHLCMVARGVEKKESYMTTSAILGNFREDKVKDEFFRLIGR